MGSTPFDRFADTLGTVGRVAEFALVQNLQPTAQIARHTEFLSPPISEQPFVEMGVLAPDAAWIGLPVPAAGQCIGFELVQFSATGHPTDQRTACWFWVQRVAGAPIAGIDTLQYVKILSPQFVAASRVASSSITIQQLVQMAPVNPSLGIRAIISTDLTVTGATHIFTNEVSGAGNRRESEWAGPFYKPGGAVVVTGGNIGGATGVACFNFRWLETPNPRR